MNFSQGQIWFGVIFFLAFVIVMVFAYRADRKINKMHYRGVWLVLAAIVAFLLIYRYLSKIAH
jgi:hypothetical protein